MELRVKEDKREREHVDMFERWNEFITTQLEIQAFSKKYLSSMELLLQQLLEARGQAVAIYKTYLGIKEKEKRENSRSNLDKIP